MLHIICSIPSNTLFSVLIFQVSSVKLGQGTDYKNKVPRTQLGNITPQNQFIHVFTRFAVKISNK